MANLLDKFNKHIVGSKSKDNDYKPRIVSSGDLERISGIEVVLNSWNILLNIPKGTYDHDPELGSDLHKLVFQPADNRTMNKIKNEIERCLMTYDDRAKITNISIKFLTNKKGFNVTIDVNYRGEPATLKTSILENTLINLTG